MALGTAVLVATLSFLLLTSAAKTSDLRVRGSVEGAFRPAYDILVRPRGSFTDLERREGVVRSNYLSGLFGGITLENYDVIRRIPRVDVAAPIANLGYIMPSGRLPVPLEHLVNSDAVQIYRVREISIAHGGRSRYPGGYEGYVYFTRRDRFSRGNTESCQGFSMGAPVYEPRPVRRRYMLCFSALSPGQGSDYQDERYPPGRVGTNIEFSFPVLAAGIDPEQESRLLGLDEAIVSGRFLRPREGAPARTYGGSTFRARLAPAIASTSPYVRESRVVEIERLALPNSANLNQRLSSPEAYDFLTKRRGTLVERKVIGVKDAYEEMLARSASSTAEISGTWTDNYWVPSDVQYEAASASSDFRPRRVNNPPSVWANPTYGDTGYIFPPPSNRDVQFRRLRTYVGTHLTEGTLHRRPAFRIVGRYDPSKLPGFSPLSRVPLETYYPPLLQPADEPSRRALGGKPLRPTQNLGDYIQQPPLFLTTLEALKPFLDPKAFEGPKDRRRAPISAIRIRVSGVKGPDELSMARIRAVALEIRDKTGLDVDITAGSSPRTLLVDMPPGKFGRPRLLLEEGWSKKGVSVAFLRAVDDKTFALGGVILLAAGFFVGNGAFAAVRTRRRELGTLLCVGWSPRSVFSLVLLELALIGALAGTLGTGIAVGLAAAFDLDVSPLRAALVLPLATALALIAGLIPAWMAARGTPLDAVLPLLRGEARGQRVRGLPSLAAANLRRMRGRTFVGIAALAAGVATLGVLLAINTAFEGSLVGTLLGEAILVRVSGLDFVSVAITLMLAALALADVLYINLRERAPELLTLKTSGWSDRQLLTAVGLEALGLGLLGGLAGVIVGLVAGTLIDLPLGHLVLTMTAAGLGGIVVALLASLAPLIHVVRLAPTTVFAEE